MSKINNPHDRFFKAIFSQKELALSFIKQLIPKEVSEKLDLKTFDSGPNSYVDEQLKEHISDIIYTCKQKSGEDIQVCLLIEHKSYPERYPHVQLLRYMINIYQQTIIDRAKLKTVIPIVLYHGKQRWHYKNFEAYFDQSSFLQFIPQFEYILVDLSNLSDKKILALEKNFLINSLLAMKHRRDTEYLLNNLECLFIYIEQHKKIEVISKFINAFFVYLVNAYELSKTQLHYIFKKLPKKTKRIAMTTYDRIVKESMEKGMEKGIHIKNEKMIVQCFQKFPEWTDKQIAEFVDVTIEFVQKIKAKIKQ